MSIRQAIIDYSKEIGIDAIGFCKATPQVERLAIFQERKEQGYACSIEGFEDMGLKVQPKYWLEGARSFIVILESYALEPNKKSLKPLPVKISKASITKDYHLVINEKLQKLSRFVEVNYNSKTKAFCDNQGFSDRQIALKAGLGVIGKNSFLINENYGTCVFIGYLLTDLDIEEYDEPISLDYCNNCSKCIRACPSNAIVSDQSKYQINAAACISYLTQSKVLSDNEKKQMSNHIYGCDICQLACPYNKDKHNKKMEDIIDAYVDAKSILTMDNNRFKETFKKTASGWRGRKHLQKNAIIALGNNPTTESVQLLNSYYDDKRDDIRKEVICSLGRIGTKEAIEILYLRYQQEKNDELKQFIKKYLD